MIIPLGHDKGVFRVPYVTIGIMVVCTLLQIYATALPSPEQAMLAFAQQRRALAQEVWAEFGQDYLKQHQPRLLRRAEDPMEARTMAGQLRSARRAVFDEFVAGQLAPKTHPLYRKWEKIQHDREKGMGLLAYGYRPQGKAYTIFTHMFIHGGWLHLIGNMLFLWLCGCNLEDRWGRRIWVGMYLAAGVVAAWVWAAMHQFHSETPAVGASGAIAGAMGAFLIIHYNARIRLLYAFFFGWRFRTGTFEARAYWALPLWFLQQLLGMVVEGPLVSVAYSAHMGGFVFGLLFAVGMRLGGVDQRLRRQAAQQATVYHGHPLFLQALEHLDHGQQGQARETFQRLLAEQPDHVEGAIHLARLVLAPPPSRDGSSPERQTDPYRVPSPGDGPDEATEATRLASRAVVLAKRAGDNLTAQQLHADLQARYPGEVLDVRALFAVAESWESVDAQHALDVYEQLIKHYPNENILPKALLNSAKLLMGPLREPDTAKQVLEHVRQRHADSPFADRALQMLEQLDAGPTNPAIPA